MSTTIDDRVVRMSFDNKGFESGVNETMSSLEKLKNSLNFSKGSSSDLNLSGIASGIEQLNGKFSAMGIVGMRTFQRLTDAALDFGKKLINTVTVDAIKDGFHEYELQMDSVKTIMASTGEDIGTVNKYLEELNLYADKTIYSFSDMTNNIGKFTNSGVKLEDAVMAIKGISNEAALSGANTQEASRAMYNFAQALSGGSVKLRDWMSIENANMATAEFKQQLIDSAVEAGTLRKEADGTYKVITKNGNGAEMKETITNIKNFRDSLSYNWMTSDVLTTTLKRYADDTTELGKKAYDAAQDVTTFSKLIDTLKEALGSSWNRTFQLVFGDFEEAKKFWTEVSQALSELIDGFGNARNELLKFWHDNGGRDAAIDSLRNAWAGLKEIMNTVGEAFRNVFPPMTGEKLLEITQKIKDVTANFKLTDQQANTLKDIFSGLFSIVKIGVRIFDSVGNSVKNFISIIRPLITVFNLIMAAIGRFVTGIANSENMLDYIIKNIGNLFSDIQEIIREWSPDLAGIFEKLFTGLTAAIEPIKKKILSLIKSNDKFESSFEKLTKTIDKGKEKLFSFFPMFDKKDKIDKATNSVNKLNKAINETGKAAKKNNGSTKGLLEDQSLISKIISILKSDNTITNKINKIKTAVKKAVDEFKQIGILGMTQKVLSLGKSFDKLTSSVGKMSAKTKSSGSFFDNIKKQIQSLSILQFAQKQLTTFHNFINGLVPKISKGLKDLFGTIKTQFPKIVKYFAGNDVGDLLDNVTKLFTIGWYHNINKLIKTQTKGLDTIVKSLSTGTDRITKSISAIFDSFNSIDKLANKKTSILKDDHVSRNMIKLAGAIALFSVALVQLAKVNPAKLGIALGAVVAEIVILFKTFSKLQTLSKDMDSIGDMGILGSIFNQFLKLGMVIRTFTNVVKGLGELNTASIIQGILGLLAIIEILLHTLKKLIQFNDMSSSGIISMDAISKGLITFAIGIRVLTSSVKALGAMSFVDMVQGLAGVLVLLEAINLFTRESKTYQIDTKSAFALILTIASIKMMASAALSLGTLDITSFAQGLVGVVLLLSAIYLFTKEAKSYKIDVASALALVLTIETIKMMTSAALSLAGLDFTSFIQGLAGVLTLLEAINLFTKEVSIISTNIGTIVILLTVTAMISSFTKTILGLAELNFTQVIQGVFSVIAFLTAISFFLTRVSTMHVKASDLAFLVSLSGAIVNISKTIALLGTLEPDQLMRGSTALGGVILALLASIAVLANVKGSIKEGASGLVVMALAIMILVPSLEKLGSLDTDKIVSILVSLGGSLLILFTAGYAMGKYASVVAKGAGSMALMAVAILILSPALKLLSTINMEQICPLLVSLAASLIVLFTAGYFMGQNALLLADGGLAMILLAGAILILAPALRLLATMDLGNLATMLIGLAGALTILYIAGVAFGTSAPLIAEGAGSLLLFGGAIALLGAGLLAIAYAMPILGVGLKEFSDNVNEAGANITENLGKQMADIVKIAGDFIMGVFAYIAQGIKEGLPAIGKFLIDSFVGLINALANAIRTEGPRILSAVMNLISAIIELSITGIQMVLQMIPGIGEFLADKMEGVKTAVRERLAPDSMAEIGSDAMGNNGLAGGIASQEGAVTNASGLLGNGAINEIGNFLTGGKGFNMGSFLGVDMSDGMLSTTGLLGNSASSMNDSIFNSLGNIDTSSYGFGVGEDYASGIDMSQFNVEQSMQNLTGNVTDSLKMDTDFEKLAGQNISSYTGQFQNNSNKNTVKKSASNLANEGVGGAASKKQGYINAGTDAARGYGDGLNDKDAKNYVSRSASNLAAEGLTSVKKAQKSNSPSKEFMKLGVFGGQGYALGLANMVKTVKDSGANLGSSALDGMRAALANLSEMASSEMITDPMIRPVLDLSNIQNGIGTMNSMFGSPLLGLQASLAGGGGAIHDIYNAVGSMGAYSNSNNDMVGEMMALRSDVKNLGQAMSNMKMYMDGREVGGIVSHEVDRRLGIRYLRNKREGRA